MGGYIVVSSITYAYMGRDLLERTGCRARVERAPKEISKCGCHYLLRVRDYPLNKALDTLQRGHIRILGSGGERYGIS